MDLVESQETDTSTAIGASVLTALTNASTPFEGNFQVGGDESIDLGVMFRQKGIMLLEGLLEGGVAASIIGPCYHVYLRCQRKQSRLWAGICSAGSQVLFSYLRDEVNVSSGALFGIFAGGVILTFGTIRMGISQYDFEALYAIPGVILTAIFFTIGYLNINHIPEISKPDVLFLPSLALSFALLEMGAKVIHAAMKEDTPATSPVQDPAVQAASPANNSTPAQGAIPNPAPVGTNQHNSTSNRTPKPRLDHANNNLKWGWPSSWQWRP